MQCRRHGMGVEMEGQDDMGPGSQWGPPRVKDV